MHVHQGWKLTFQSGTSWRLEEKYWLNFEQCVQQFVRSVPSIQRYPCLNFSHVR